MANLMEQNRLKLHELLLTFCPNVYFQPPETLKISYPAIIYSRVRISNKLADNGVYGQRYRYKLVVIDRDPDSEVVDKVSRISPSCIHTSNYKASNLNHDTFELTY